MSRTAITTLSAFRKVCNSSYIYGYRNRYAHSNIELRKIGQSKLCYDTFNMCMLSAFVKEYTKNPTEPTNEDNDVDCEYCANFIKREKELKFVCKITGSEKRENNVDCACKDKCIVEKSEIAIVSYIL